MMLVATGQWQLVLMSSLPELTQLLAKIAGEVGRPNAVDLNFEDYANAETCMAIGSLTKSLNSVDHSSSGTRVLDAALSLMCLKTTEVCRVRIERLIQTMISVLYSSVSCKISRLGREGPELLQVGCSVTFEDCVELMRVGADVLESLEANNGFFHDLLLAVLRTAVFSSVWPSVCDQGIEITSISRRTAISRLMDILSDNIYPGSHETLLRSFSWYLDPLLLKNDISEVLREIMQRPFLSLKAEFYNRPTWRRMILGFVTSPVMFRQASTLLHSWFLITGLTFVLELHIALVSAILDMVSRPMAWGITMEMGLKYPFAHAYFPNNLKELLGVLNRSISCNNFVDLVNYIELAVICSEASLEPTICMLGHETILGSIDNNSTWSMLMKFPTWFYFGSVLIFYHEDIQDSYISKVISDERNLHSSNDRDLNEASILYLSFVMSPVDKSHGDRLAEHFLKLSRSWSLAGRSISSYKQCSSSGAHNKVSLNLSKKLRINKDHDDKLALAAHKRSFAALASWLKEFDDVCVESWTKPFLRYASVDSKGQENASTRSIKLFNKIPLGILILYSGILSDGGCELLLYYATTGEILQHREIQILTSDYHEHEIALRFGSDGRKWAFDGACLVFSFFDIIVEISVMLFDCEATRLDFICHLKGKVCKYLLRCVEILLHLCIQQLVEAKGRVGLLDLFRRLIQWKQLGREIFEGSEEFNDVIDGFAKKFLKLAEYEELI